MNYDTPLAEVAKLLPAGSAKVLTAYPWTVQESVLANVRNVLVMWEANNVQFDPIQFEGAVNGVVLTLAGTIAPFMGAVAELSRQLQQAVELNKRYYELLQGEGKL